MTKILPRHFDLLKKEEKEMWQYAQACLQGIEDKFTILKTSTPRLTGFESFSSKRNPSSLAAWTISGAACSFKLCLVQYESGLTTSRGGMSWDPHLYLFGYMPLKRNFGVALIRPETILDKVNELFFNAEIDFEDQRKFNYKYYVLAQDKEHFRKMISKDFLKFMELTKGLQVEFRNHKCMFRLPKAVDKRESIQTATCESLMILHRII